MSHPGIFKRRSPRLNGGFVAVKKQRNNAEQYLRKVEWEPSEFGERGPQLCLRMVFPKGKRYWGMWGDGADVWCMTVVP